MELGGTPTFLVFDDADIDDAVEGAIIAKLRNIGEACTAATAFHVAARWPTSSPPGSPTGWASSVGRGTEGRASTSAR